MALLKVICRAFIFVIRIWFLCIHSIYFNFIQSAADGIYLARHIGLHSQVPIASTALTVNRLCGSGFQAIVSAAQVIGNIISCRCRVSLLMW